MKPLEKRKKDFALEIAAYKEKYDREMLLQFYEYWTEINPKGRLMAFEKERNKRAFEVGKRLATWARNQKSKNIKVNQPVTVVEKLKRKHGIGS